MKKRLFTIGIICVLLISLLCIGVNAQADERVVLDNSVFYIDIPEGYMFDTEQSDNFYVVDSDFGSQSLEFFVQGNLMFPKGVTKAEDDEIISKVKRITQWSNTVSVTEVEKLVINGQKAALIKATDEFLYETAVEYYVFNTKEAVCVIGVTYSTEEEKQEIQQILSTFVINGTYFEGDEPIKKHDFSKSPDYYEAVKANADAYYDYYEEFDDDMWGIVGIVLIIALLIPGTIIALIIFIYLWRKNKKLVKEYEGYFGPIYAVRNNVMAQRRGQNGYGYAQPQQMYAPQQPYQPQPYPYMQGNPQQSYGQPYQPQPQPSYPPQPTQAPAPQPQPPVNGQGDAPQPTGQPDDKK